MIFTQAFKNSFFIIVRMFFLPNNEGLLCEWWIFVLCWRDIQLFQFFFGGNDAHTRVWTSTIWIFHSLYLHLHHCLNHHNNDIHFSHRLPCRDNWDQVAYHRLSNLLYHNQDDLDLRCYLCRLYSLIRLLLWLDHIKYYYKLLNEVEQEEDRDQLEDLDLFIIDMLFD